MNILEMSDQEIGRRQSLQQLREMGIDPYPAAEYPTNAFSTEIRDEFKEDEKREVVIAGRMMSRRIMGKASFVELQDSKGRIQVYITRDDICPGEDKNLYNVVFKKLLDIGDFIGVRGFVFKTQRGEISVHAQELVLLSKSLKPLPIVKYKDGVAYDKFDDPELRARRRYVDLVVNDGGIAIPANVAGILQQALDLVLVPFGPFLAIRDVFFIQGIRDLLIGQAGSIEGKHPDHHSGVLRGHSQISVLELVPI